MQHACDGTCGKTFHVGAEWLAVGLCIAVVAARKSPLIGLILAAGLIAIMRAIGVAPLS